MTGRAGTLTPDPRRKPPFFSSPRTLVGRTGRRLASQPRSSRSSRFPANGRPWASLFVSPSVAAEMCTEVNILTAWPTATQCGIYAAGSIIMECPVSVPPTHWLRPFVRPARSLVLREIVRTMVPPSSLPTSGFLQVSPVLRSPRRLLTSSSWRQLRFDRRSYYVGPVRQRRRSQVPLIPNLDEHRRDHHLRIRRPFRGSAALGQPRHGFLHRSRPRYLPGIDLYWTSYWTGNRTRTVDVPDCDYQILLCLIFIKRMPAANNILPQCVYICNRSLGVFSVSGTACRHSTSMSTLIILSPHLSAKARQSPRWAVVPRSPSFTGSKPVSFRGLSRSPSLCLIRERPLFWDLWGSYFGTMSVINCDGLSCSGSSFSATTTEFSNSSGLSFGGAMQMQPLENFRTWRKSTSEMTYLLWFIIQSIFPVQQQ
jgi:hypothetical protein